MRYLPDKKNKTSPGSPALATARIAPKICQGQPRRMQSECSRCRTNRFAFGERVNTVKTGRSVFTIRLKPNNKNVFSLLQNESVNSSSSHRESKKGATLTMAITL